MPRQRGEEHRDHDDARGDADIADLVKTPAEDRDQIDDRVGEAHRLPERRQHVDRIEAAAEERQRRENEQRNDLQLLEALGPQPDDEAEQAEGRRGQDQERQHPDRMRDLDRHEQAGGGEDDEAEDDRLGGGRADIAEHDLERRYRRRQNLEDRADEAREIDAERGVHHALREQRHHDQPRHDERAIADALDLRDARADRGAEHHEIQRRRKHRRHDALEDRAPGARHLEPVDRPDRAVVHGSFLTRSTKMSSSELCSVWMSLNRMLARISPSSSRVMPRPLGLRVIGVDQLAPVRRRA